MKRFRKYIPGQSVAIDVPDTRIKTAIVLDEFGNGGGRRADCTCECGTRFNADIYALTSGKTRSCGCLHRDMKKTTPRTHGLSKTRTYNSWMSMKARCYTTTLNNYERYGGRGIIVCERWIHSFEAFLADMGERPEGMSLDRIDNAGNYEPGNCRWASGKTQSNNTRRNVHVTHDGQTRTIFQWAAHAGLSGHVLWKRLNVHQWTMEEALSIPLGGRRAHKPTP